MTLHGARYEVGVRELHDKLSEHLERVQAGSEVVVTRRGQAIARLSAVDVADPFEELTRRGVVTPPARPRGPVGARVRTAEPVSDHVAEQRR